MECEEDEEECGWTCTKWSACINNTQTRTCTLSNCTGDGGERPKETKRCRVKDRVRVGECPEECVCTGSTVKCELEGGRRMTVYAGKSGNVIVQIKGVNMSTKVTLYKENNTIYGKFKGNKTKEIKFYPDQIREEIRNKIKARFAENESIELDEDGFYQVEVKKRARLFWVFPIKEKVKFKIDSETGEVIKMRKVWWGFLANDIEEEAEICIVGQEYENTAVDPIDCECPEGYEFEVMSQWFGPCPIEGMSDCPASTLKCVEK
jgi:hypothetical protein